MRPTRFGSPAAGVIQKKKSWKRHRWCSIAWGLPVGQAAAGGEVGIVTTSSGRIACLFPDAIHSGREVAVLIRPEHIGIAESAAKMPAGCENHLPGKMIRETYLGETNEYLVSVGAT